MPPPPKKKSNFSWGGNLKLYDFGDLGARNLSQTSGFSKTSPELDSHRNPINFDPFHKVLGLNPKLYNFEDLGAQNLSQTSGFFKTSLELHSHRNPTNSDPFHKVFSIGGVSLQ